MGETFKTSLNDSITTIDPTEASTIQESCDGTLETSFLILNSITAAIIIPGNLLVVLVIGSNSGLRQQQMNIFLASLSLSDIVMGACVVPGFALFCSGCTTYTLSKYCWFLRGPKDVALASGIYNVLAISYDRCLAIYWPLKYSATMTKRRVIAIICSIWVLSISIASMRNFWQHTTTGAELDRIDGIYNMVLVIGVLSTPIIIVSVINVAMIFTIRKQSIQLNVQRTQGGREMQETAEEIQLETRSSRKGTITCLLVITVFVLSWIPRIIFNIHFLIVREMALVNKLLIKVSMFFLTLQSSINPFIYSLVRAEFRQAAIKLLKWNGQ